MHLVGQRGLALGQGISVSVHRGDLQNCSPFAGCRACSNGMVVLVWGADFGRISKCYEFSLNSDCLFGLCQIQQFKCTQGGKMRDVTA